MLHELGDALLSDKMPEARLTAIVDQFVQHPHISSVIDILAQKRLGCSPKELQVVQNVVDQLRLALTTHKNQRNRESMRLFQTLLNLITPPLGANLQRATAKFFGLSSRRGLRAAQYRVASQLVDVEGGIHDRLTHDQAAAAPKHLFYPSDRKTRADWLAGEERVLDI